MGFGSWGRLRLVTHHPSPVSHGVVLAYRYLCCAPGRKATRHSAAFRSIPQHSAALRSTPQHPVAFRGIPQHSASSVRFRSIPQHSASSVAFRGVPWLIPQLKKTDSTRAQRPMPEDADQDILEALVCLWPTVRSNRAKLTCQGRGGELGLGLARFNFYFGRAFAGHVQLKSFLGPVAAKDTESN